MTFPITVDLAEVSAVEEPLYKIISDAVKSNIMTGLLKPGERLPSTRELAQMLSISRQTALKCYERLQDLGLIEMRIGSGTVVRADLIFSGELGPMHRPKNPAMSDFSSSYAKQLLQQSTCDVQNKQKLNSGMISKDLLPIKQWHRCISDQYDRLPEYASVHDSFGLPDLRNALAQWLRRTRGVICSPEQVIICGSADLARALIADTLFDAGIAVAFEEPGFQPVQQAFRARSIEVLHVPIDSEGLQVAELIQLDPAPQAVYVTPAHHDPSGATMSSLRRRALVSWAQSNDRLIIEDDFDSELTYGQSCPSALYGSEPHRVIHLNSFWKLLFPLTSLAYMVVPPHMVPLFQSVKALEEVNFSILDQLALAQFIAEGCLDGTIRKAKSLYQKNRQELIFALAQTFGAAVHVSRFTSGTNLLVCFPNEIDERIILEAADEAGFQLLSTRRWYAGIAKENEFLIPFSCSDGEPLRGKVSTFAGLLTEFIGGSVAL